MYDIFFIRHKDEIDEQFTLFKRKYPTAKRVETYQEALRKSFTTMCWIVPAGIIPLDDFKFEYKVNDVDKIYKHVFKLTEDDVGVALLSKTAKITNDERDYNFFYNTKIINIASAIERPDDVIFISYGELNANDNYAKLLTQVPYAKRVDGIKGIHAAHKAAAKISSTKMFWVLDGDAQVLDTFKFKHAIYRWDFDSVYVWRSKNPINGLEYGYGGAKLLPRKQTLAVEESAVDMTTSLSLKFNAMDEVSNITAFNTDAFSTWRSAFRECAKLSSGIINRDISSENQHRLDTWCTINNGAAFGEWAIIGANEGKAYGEEHASDLYKINDFEWLHEQFSKHTLE